MVLSHVVFVPCDPYLKSYLSQRTDLDRGGFSSCRRGDCHKGRRGWKRIDEAVVEGMAVKSEEMMTTVLYTTARARRSEITVEAFLSIEWTTWFTN